MILSKNYHDYVDADFNIIYTLCRHPRVGPAESFNPERGKNTFKMHLNAIFMAFWQKSEPWNPAIDEKVPSMTYKS